MTTIVKQSILLLVLGAACSVCAYNSQQPATLSRRSVLATATASVVAALSTEVTPASAETTEEDVYFGVGCFWHIQHEFIEGERTLLGRSDSQLTSAAGYAGGTATGKEGRVCYHNVQGIADYGRLGHGEVVGMTIPQSKIEDFATLYFSLFDPRTKDRVDPGDRGGEYRSLLGLPGAMDHPSFPLVEAAAKKAGFKLLAGAGNDPDTFGKQIVWVYDTKVFPFHQAEVYHQYHNDFQSAPYGKKYNKLADLAFEEGRIVSTGCPDRV